MNTRVEIVVVVVRHENRIRYFRSDRDFWVLDVEKWRQELIAYGYEVPEFNDAYRFGMRVVNHENASQFLEHMSMFELARDRLSFELAVRYTTAHSWWYVADLFPIMFVDFDAKRVAAFYLDGPKMERYIPDGWTGAFVDFANEYDESVFPAEEKFWVKEGSDLLAMVTARSSKS